MRPQIRHINDSTTKECDENLEDHAAQLLEKTVRFLLFWKLHRRFRTHAQSAYSRYACGYMLISFASTVLSFAPEVNLAGVGVQYQREHGEWVLQNGCLKRRQERGEEVQTMMRISSQC